MIRSVTVKVLARDVGALDLKWFARLDVVVDRGTESVLKSVEASGANPREATSNGFAKLIAEMEGHTL